MKRIAIGVAAIWSSSCCRRACSCAACWLARWRA